MMGIIYCITNKLNGKRYIGQTKRKKEVRIKEHFQTAKDRRNLHLYNAINKYGIDNFEVNILKDNLSEDELDMWEMYYIGFYDTFNNGYNNTIGGGGVRGYHHSGATKAKISQNHNKDMYTKERALKISKATKGVPKSDLHKKHISESRKGKCRGTENGFYNKHHTKETLLKNSLAHRKYIFKQIDISTNTVVNTFSSINDVCDYVISNNLSQAKKTSIAYRIYQTIYNHQQQAYGYGWIGEKCNDYPVKE